jgi:hypothetical protein
MKRLLLILFILVLGIFFGVFWGKSASITTTGTKSVTLFPSPQPTQQGGLGLLPTPIIASVPRFSLPATTDEYIISATAPTPSSIARYFGFQSDPAVITGSIGNSYIWSTTNQSLIVEGNPMSVGLSKKVPTSTKLTKTTQEYQLIALNTLVDVPGQPKDLNFKLVKTLFVSGNATSEKESDRAISTVVIFYYQYYLTDFPLFFGSPSLSLASVALTADGSILSLTFHLMPTLSKTAKRLVILPYESLVKNLHANSVFTRYIDETNPSQEYKETDVAPTSIAVTGTTFGYYLDAKNQTVFPVVVFEGVGKSLSGKRIVATFYSRVME